MWSICKELKDPAIVTPLADCFLPNMEPNPNLLDSEWFAVCACLAVSQQKACWISSFKMFHER